MPFVSGFNRGTLDGLPGAAWESSEQRSAARSWEDTVEVGGQELTPEASVSPGWEPEGSYESASEVLAGSLTDLGTGKTGALAPFAFLFPPGHKPIG